MQVRKQQLELDAEQQIGSKLGKEYIIKSAGLNMPANLENSAVATGLEKVSFLSNSKERQCQRMLKLPHNCTHFACGVTDLMDVSLSELRELVMDREA